jgi:hypothetical protein
MLGGGMGGPESEEDKKKGRSLTSQRNPVTRPSKLESGSEPAGVRGDDQHRKTSARFRASVTLERGKGPGVQRDGRRGERL